MTSRFRESNTGVFDVLSQEYSDLRDMKWRMTERNFTMRRSKICPRLQILLLFKIKQNVMGGACNTHTKSLAGNAEGNSELKRPKNRWEGGNKMDSKGTV
jgi:hypothetical protein